MRIVNKTAIPLMLSVLSIIVFMSPEILGIFIKKGVILSQSESITWAAIMLGSAATGLAYGFYLFVKHLSSLGKTIVIMGMLSCLVVISIESKMICFFSLEVDEF